jgi:hypothetical protein
MPEHSRSSFSSVDFLNSVSSPSMASVAIGEKRGQVVNQARIGSKIFSPSQLKSQRLESRVMSYGYSSGGILSKSVSDIDDVARELLTRLHGQRRTTAERARPILFIAHSLGGVVVKQVSHFDSIPQCITI